MRDDVFVGFFNLSNGGLFLECADNFFKARTYAQMDLTFPQRIEGFSGLIQGYSLGV
jgi:hypothetical protein